MSQTTASTSATTIDIASTSDTDRATTLHPLVTQKLVDTGKYYCPFLERGFCREQSMCNFSHDYHSSTKIPSDFCHFYLANQCLYGQECKFIHSEPITHLNEDNQNLDDRLADQLADMSLASRYDDGQDENYYELQHTSTSEMLVNDDYYDNAHEEQTTATDQLSQQNSDNNLQLLGTLVASSSSDGWSRKMLSGNDGAGKPPASKIIDKNANASTTKAWQGGRLLASLRGESSSSNNNNNGNEEAQLKDLPLCPYSLASGGCPFAEGVCTYLHGQICDLCCMPCLHPYDEAQQRQHRDDCLREHEREMELSFAVQRSKDKICGICMDTVVEKKPITSSRFGILEKCNHIFCLDCIRKWRGTKQFESKTIRACPECRVNSDFVIPSKYWVEDEDDKQKLIHDYKAALKSKPCRYFNEGKGECPFAGSCFYKHAYPDGRIAEMEAPKPRRRLYGARGPTSLTNFVLWSLIRSFDDDDWSNDEESDSRYYVDYYDDDDEDDEDEDDNVGEIDRDRFDDDWRSNPVIE